MVVVFAVEPKFTNDIVAMVSPEGEIVPLAKVWGDLI